MAARAKSDRAPGGVLVDAPRFQFREEHEAPLAEIYRWLDVTEPEDKLRVRGEIGKLVQRYMDEARIEEAAPTPKPVEKVLKHLGEKAGPLADALRELAAADPEKRPDLSAAEGALRLAGLSFDLEDILLRVQALKGAADRAVNEMPVGVKPPEAARRTLISGVSVLYRETTGKRLPQPSWEFVYEEGDSGNWDDCRDLGCYRDGPALRLAENCLALAGVPVEGEQRSALAQAIKRALKEQNPA